MGKKRILLANPRGFCAGVERAIAIVERALERFGAPVYVRHEIVHNAHVVEGLRRKGAVFVGEVDEIPEGAVAIFSAHGVPKAARIEAQERGLRVFDATCPLVTKVHLEAIRLKERGYEVALIGHRGHPEVEGTLGQAEGILLAGTPEEARALSVPEGARVAFVTQTTLSVDDAAKVAGALRERFPGIEGPKKDDICYATQNRQDAVKALARESGAVIVVGSPNSSNSNRLREVAEAAGARAALVDGPGEVDERWLEGVDERWLEGVEVVGVSAGASAPESVVREVIGRLRDLGYGEPEELEGIEERVEFPLPKGL